MNREKKSRNAVSFIQNDEKTLAAVSEQSYLRNRTEYAVKLFIYSGTPFERPPLLKGHFSGAKGVASQEGFHCSILDKSSAYCFTLYRCGFLFRLMNRGSTKEVRHTHSLGFSLRCLHRRLFVGRCHFRKGMHDGTLGLLVWIDKMQDKMYNEIFHIIWLINR